MSFEDFILRKVDRERREKPREALRDTTFDTAHVSALKILNNRDYSIQAPDFFDLYGEENVKNDMRAVKAKRDAYQMSDTPEMKEAAMASEVFEAIVIQHAELSNWLGNNVSVLKTSRYDDLFRGTDMVAEWRQPEGKPSQVLALAVDITFGARAVEKKLDGMRRRIDKGELTSIKYFKTADGSFRGERNGVPHVVIGVDKDSVRELARLWMRNDKTALAAHPIQRMLVDEMCEQLKVIQAYAKSIGQQKVADAYANSLAIIEPLKHIKSSVSLSGVPRDRVYDQLMSQTKSVFRI